MQLSVSEAKARLTDLVRRAEAGEEVTLTRRGEPTVRLIAIPKKPSADERWALLEALHGSAKHSFGPGAERSADFLYDDYGCPA